MGRLISVVSLDWVPPVLRGAIMVIFASACLSGMHSLVRFISQDLHPFEIAFFRNLFGLLYFMPVLLRAGLKLLYSNRPGAHIARGTINAASMMCWFIALSIMPLADASALSLTGPLFATLGAMFVLREDVSMGRWAAVGLGILGTLVIVRPGFEEVSIGAILVITSSVLVAASKLFAKSLSRTDAPATIVAYVTLVMSIITFIPAVAFWTWPTLGQLIGLCAMGFLGSTGHLLVIRSYKYLDLSAVEPFLFSRLIWAAIIGFIVFTEVPSIWTWVGGAIIIASTTYLARRESAARRKAKALASAEASGSAG